MGARMGVIAEAVRHMLAAGMTPDDVVNAISDMESANGRPVDLAAEKRTYTPRHDLKLAVPRLSGNEWLPLREMVLRRDKYVCTYCGTAEEPLTADHIVPLSRGGSNHPDNLTACCIPCNSSKSDRLLSEWKGRYTCR